ncbi:YgjV family protein [Flammeovirga sp. SubArs3]|uniref:YgjV family protein n=1 Tax=Flammeovirga sp. SubArs3 TaxID=2995316 RepID=UPI00248B9BB9|nr:YgjV family protein [Flammeovirga sp. SubArs3]
MNSEYVGYIASAILMLSFTFKKANTLRIINSIGCIVFVIYGVMIDAWPVIISNGFIALVNAYYLFLSKQ